MVGVSEEELYNIPTADYVFRRGFLNRAHTVYHVASLACADLHSVEVFVSHFYVFFSSGFFVTNVLQYINSTSTFYDFSYLDIGDNSSDAQAGWNYS